MDLADIKSASKGDLIRLGLKIARDTALTRGRNFIYIPRRYDSNPEYAPLKDSLEEISYQVGSTRMSAFLDCDPTTAPERIWLLFGGNASVALDWLPITSFAPESPDAFLHFDYPGYGDSAGKPSRPLIRRCIDEVIETLIDRFSMDRSAITDRFYVMGHSLGCAVALDTAHRHAISKGILISPFSSVHAMGEMMVGKILPYFAADRYNNIETLRRLTDKVDKPHFHIVHGSLDDIIPISMARELHNASPGHTTLWEIPDANHNDILLLLSKELGEALTNGGKFIYDF